MGLDLERWIDVSRAACALAAAVAALAWVARSRRGLRLAALASGLGALGAASAIVDLGLRQVGVPLLVPADMGLACAGLALVTATVFAFRERSDGLRSAALLLGSTSLVTLLAAGYFAEWHSFVTERVPALRSPWMPVHAGAWCVAIAGASVAGVVRAAGRDPRAEAFARRSADLAFAAATLALFSGCVLSLQAWSSLWGWEAKSILALVAWIALGVHALLPRVDGPVERWRARAPAIAAVVMLANLFLIGYLPGAQKFSTHGYYGGALPSVAAADDGPPPALRLRLEDGPESFPLSTK